MTTPPKLTFAFNGSHYAVAGWTEFDSYARANWPLWKTTHQSTWSLQEVDRLKMMLAAHAIELERIKEVYADYVRDNAPRSLMGPNGEVWRYVGP